MSIDNFNNEHLREAVLAELTKASQLKKVVPAKIVQKHAMAEYHQSAKKNKFFSLIVILIISVIFFSFLFVAVSIYYWRWENPLLSKLSQVLPLPVALVNNNYIWLNEYNNDLTALTRYYARQNLAEEFTANDLKIIVLNKLVEKKLISQIADKLKITVSSEEQAEATKIIRQSGSSQDLDKLTEEMFGWNFNDFVNNILKYDILTEKINVYLANSKDWQKNSLNKITAYDQEIKKGTNFESLGLYLGWAGYDELPAIIMGQVKGLSVGQTTEILEDRNGYYIFKLENKLPEENRYELSHVFVKKYDLNDYLQLLGENVKIYTFIKF
jgi:hypothetical protein